MRNATVTTFPTPAPPRWRCPHQEPCHFESDCKFSLYMDGVREAREWVMSLDEITALELLRKAVYDYAVNPHIALLGMDPGDLLELAHEYNPVGRGRASTTIEVTVAVTLPKPAPVRTRDERFTGAQI